MYPKEYIQYLIQFHAYRDYFECHEILEEYWKSKPKAKRKKIWVGLIQIAVSLYHHRRKNFTGSLKMMKNAILIIKEEKEEVSRLGLSYQPLIDLLESELSSLEAKKPYESINLPIEDHHLIQQCQKICQQNNITWCVPSKMNDVGLIHRHTRRDRSDVIQERLIQKKLREKRK